MAYRRSVAARAKLFYQQQHQPRLGPPPPFPHVHRDRDEPQANPISKIHETRNYSGFYGAGSSFGAFRGPINAFRDRRFGVPVAAGGMVYGRSFSSGSVGGSVGEGAADGIEMLNDMVGVLGDKAAEVAPAAVSEVAVAAADSFFPVAALQYLIDYVHVYTGFSWWASIAVTTVLIRSVQIPILINQLKSTTKFTLLRPKLEAINEEMQDKDMAPNAVAEGQAKIKKLFKEYGVTPFTPLKGIFISAPVFASFFFAVNGMAEKIPSFKEGGAFWFTDLTTPDTMYIFPVLTALTFWINVESNTQEGLEGNPSAGTIKNVSRVFAALTIPFTASFPKAIFCYWITSNMFSLAYGLVIKRPQVKKFLNIPIIPVAPPSAKSKPKPGFSFFEALNKFAAAQQKSLSPSSEVSSKPTNQNISSSSVLNQRINSLAKEVKGRKKGKKR